MIGQVDRRECAIPSAQPLTRGRERSPTPFPRPVSERWNPSSDGGGGPEHLHGHGHGHGHGHDLLRGLAGGPGAAGACGEAHCVLRAGRTSMATNRTRRKRTDAPGRHRRTNAALRIVPVPVRGIRTTEALRPPRPARGGRVGGESPPEAQATESTQLAATPAENARGMRGIGSVVAWSGGTGRVPDPLFSSRAARPRHSA